jgi:hypothetical protein
MWSVEWTIVCPFVFCRLTIVMSVLRELQLLIISLWYLQTFRTLSVYKRRMSCFDGQLNQISVNALHTFFLILYSAFLYEIRCSGTSLWELLFTHLAGIVLWQTIRETTNFQVYSVGSSMCMGYRLIIKKELFND